MVKLTKKATNDPQVITLARNIVARVPSKDWRGEVEHVQAWVKNNIRYTLDPISAETIQTPEVTLKQKSGDCDDHAILVGALLGAIGHPVRFRAVSVRQSPQTLCHVYAETRLGNKWVSVETTENWPVGYIPEHVNLKNNVVRHV